MSKPEDCTSAHLTTSVCFSERLFSGRPRGTYASREIRVSSEDSRGDGTTNEISLTAGSHVALAQLKLSKAAVISGMLSQSSIESHL